VFDREGDAHYLSFGILYRDYWRRTILMVVGALDKGRFIRLGSTFSWGKPW